jgi:glycosyltransferase involved in cell wall biosynthesis
MRIKLCIVTSWFPNKKNPHLAPFVYSFARDLVDSGLDVSVISIRSSDESPIQNDRGLSIFRINRKFPFLSIYNLISKIKPDIIHVQAPNYFGSMALIPAKIKKIPVIATAYRAEIDSVNFVLNCLRKLTLKQYDRIVTCSEFSKSLAINAGAKKERTIVIYNSCNETLFLSPYKTSSRKKLGLPQDKKIILFIGNLIEIKGIFTLIYALINLRDKIDFYTIIIGKGEEEKVLRDLIVKENLADKVTLKGWYPQQQLPDFYHSSDIFVLPSFVEGQSVAILEAMASGLPIIATAVGGNLETIEDGVNGFLIPVGDHNYLSNKISDLLRSEALRNSFSKNCRDAYSKRFSKKIQIEKFLKLYETIMKKSV